MNEALAEMTHAMTQDEYGYVAAALDLSYEEAETLCKSEVRTPSEQHALRKFQSAMGLHGETSRFLVRLRSASRAFLCVERTRALQ